MKTFVINLDRRKDRLDKLQIPFEYERFPATDGHLRRDVHKKMKGHLGCRDSHKRLLELIQERGLDSALVFEDDVVFAEDFEQKLETAIKELPEDWDLVYLGGWGTSSPYSEHLKKAERILTTHAYMIRGKFIPTLLEAINAREFKIDVLFCSAIKKGKCFVLSPVLAWQIEGYSDIMNTIRANKHLIPMKKPTLETVQSMDLTTLYPFAVDNADNRRLLLGDAGMEHYKLLAWLSNQFDNSTITEIGTLGGVGTIALSYNTTNKVISYDIRTRNWGNKTPDNAEKKLVHEGYMDDVVKSSLIFYDAAHLGKEEQEFLDELVKRDWHGVVVWDDIHLNKEMDEFWLTCIAGHKVEDWTDIGHACGTGVMFL